MLEIAGAVILLGLGGVGLYRILRNPGRARPRPAPPAPLVPPGPVERLPFTPQQIEDAAYERVMKDPMREWDDGTSELARRSMKRRGL